jgi:hypothetical protein
MQPITANPVLFDKYVFNSGEKIPEELDLRGALCFNRDEKRASHLHRVLFLVQKIFYSIFRWGADANMTHGWICLGDEPLGQNEVIRLSNGRFETGPKKPKKIAAHGIFTGINTSTRDYLDNDIEVSQVHIYIPREERLRQKIVEYANQTVYNQKPAPLTDEQSLQVKSLKRILKNPDSVNNNYARTQLLKLALLDINHNESTIVIKTQLGLAKFVKECVDTHCSRTIIGCQADYNTVTITPKSEKKIAEITRELKCTLGMKERLKFSIPDMIKGAFHPTKRPKKKKMKRTAFAIADLLRGEQVKDQKNRPLALFCTPYVMMIAQSSLIINEMSDKQITRVQNFETRNEAAKKIYQWLSSDKRSLCQKFKANPIWQFNFRFGMTGDAVQLLDKFCEKHEVEAIIEAPESSSTSGSSSS